MDGRKRVLLADSSEEFRWLMWRSAANHNFFSLATVGSGRDVLLCMQKQTADLLLMDTALPEGRAALIRDKAPPLAVALMAMMERPLGAL